MDKRGIELAVNTLIVMILGVIIVVGGIALVYRLVASAQGTLNEVPARMQEEIFNMLLNQKTKIVALENTKEVGLGKTAIFTLAFQNTLNPRAFLIDASKLTLAPVGTSILTGVNAGKCQVGAAVRPCPSARVLKTTPIIQTNGKHAFYVLVDVDSQSPPGEYTFEVDVNSTPTQVYALTKVNVNVQ